MVSPSQEDDPQENNSLNNDQFNEDQTNRTSFSGIIVINSTDWSFGNYSIISVYPITGGPLFPTSNVTVISYQTVTNNMTVTTTETTSTLSNSIFFISIGVLSIWVISSRIGNPKQ
jgi:hypothetical protein